MRLIYRSVPETSDLPVVGSAGSVEPLELSPREQRPTAVRPPSRRLITLGAHDGRDRSIASARLRRAMLVSPR